MSAIVAIAAVFLFAVALHAAQVAYWKFELRQQRLALIYVIHTLCLTHATALVSAHRRTVYRDPYGVTVLDAWQREVRVFFKRVVQPVMETDPALKRYRRARAKIDALAKSKLVRRKSDDVVKMLSGLTFDVAQDVVKQSTAPGFRETNGPEHIFDGREFEIWCAESLRSLGWNVSEVGGSGDHGIDLIACKQARRIGIQCKCHGTAVSNSAVQEAHTGAVVHGLDAAAVISKTGFKKSARQAAGATGVQLLEPVGLAKLL